MKVWMVFVHARWGEKEVGRYIDSQWAEQKSAEKRQSELQVCFRAFDCRSDQYGMSSYIVEGSVADCKIVEPAAVQQVDGEPIPSNEAGN